MVAQLFEGDGFVHGAVYAQVASFFLNRRGDVAGHQHNSGPGPDFERFL